jgi:uncharacterized protein YbcV (DUF1398 family)
MNVSAKIKEAYSTANNYPDLAKKLAQAGVQSYTVDVSSSIILYQLAEGETELHSQSISPRVIVDAFDQELTIKAIRDNQQGKTDYSQFMEDMATAGVRFYCAMLTGANKRVVYVGIGGLYEENIPG